MLRLQLKFRAKYTVDCFAIEQDTFLPRDSIRFWTRRGAENWAQWLNETETLRPRKLVFIVGCLDKEPGQGYPLGNPYGGES